MSDEISQSFYDSLGFSLGNGKCISFWQQDWTNGVFKFSFPRIFALPTNKDGIVRDQGFIDDGLWCWDIKLRRNLFDWELEQYNSLLNLLFKFKVSDSLDDKVIWKGSFDGSFSDKFFLLRNVEQSPHRLGGVSYELGFSPHNVENFVWQVIVRRVAVKEELLKTNLISSDSAVCAFFWQGD